MKKLALLGVTIGTTIGGAIPMLWGDSYFSITSVLLSAAGGFAGIWLAYVTAKYLGL